MANAPLYYLSIHPMNEPAAWLGSIAYYPAALAAMHGIARVAINTAGGKVLLWDASKVALGPIGGAAFGDVYWWPEDVSQPIEEGMTKVAGDDESLWAPYEELGAVPAVSDPSSLWTPDDEIGAARDWFAEFISKWAGTWWRR